MDQMVRNDIACNCIPIVRIAFWVRTHLILIAFFDDFNCVFTQIRCLSKLLLMDFKIHHTESSINLFQKRMQNDQFDCMLKRVYL